MNQLITSAQAEDRTAMSITLSDGRILSYSKYGKEGGIPIIMNHGSPGSRIGMEEDIYHQLGLEMIYPERPAYGNSSANPNASFQSWADDVVALLDHLGIKKANIAGISGGGAYALACVAYYPNRFQSASLIASASPPQTPNYKKGMALSNRIGYWMNNYAPFLVRMASRSFANGFKQNPDKVWSAIGKQLCEWDQAILTKAKEKGMYPIFVKHLQEAFKNGVEGHTADMRLLSGKWKIPFEAIHCPILMWHGEEDTLAPIAGARALSEWLPGIETHFLPHAGHLIAEEEKILKSILQRIIRQINL